jgi:hypothetical protein
MIPVLRRDGGEGLHRGSHFVHATCRPHGEKRRRQNHLANARLVTADGRGGAIEVVEPQCHRNINAAPGHHLNRLVESARPSGRRVLDVGDRYAGKAEILGKGDTREQAAADVAVVEITDLAEADAGIGQRVDARLEAQIGDVRVRLAERNDPDADHIHIAGHHCDDSPPAGPNLYEHSSVPSASVMTG